jgi:hypothetical protein
MRSTVLLLGLVAAAGCAFNETKKPDPTPGNPNNSVLNGEAISSPIAPAPLAGGTLFVSQKTKFAYAANADKNVVDVIDTTTWTRRWTAELGDGAEPGRIVEDAAGYAYVVLRHSGKIATLDVINQKVTQRPVCAAPRGIDASGSSLIVACESGELMSLPLFDGGEAKLVQQLDRDLRDVVVSGNTIYVSRFRSAEILQIDNGAVTRMSPVAAEDHPVLSGTSVIKEYARYLPEVMWKTVLAPDGSLYAVHLYATTRTVPTVRDPQKPVPYYGGDSSIGAGAPTDPCFNRGGVVLTAVTHFVDGKPSGTVVIPFQAPAVDVAVGPSGEVAIALPALSNKLGSSGTIGGSGTAVPPPVYGTGFQHSVIVIKSSSFSGSGIVCDNGTDKRSVQGQPVALAYSSKGELLVQTREVDMLVSPTYSTYNYPPTNPSGGNVSVALTSSYHDTGFTLFHEATGSNIACMSCHPEGGDDSHTWHFDIGFRRTQSIRGGIMATAPFHWAGDEANISALSHDVFSERMGGANLSEAQTAVLGTWIDRIPAIAVSPTVDAAAVARGQALFAKADCASCHSGEHFTNNENKDVGTGGMFQVPSLRGVAARAPYMHDGCAPDLMSRFTGTATDPTCGGTNHGNVSGLTAADLSDLVTYVQTL